VWLLDALLKQAMVNNLVCALLFLASSSSSLNMDKKKRFFVYFHFFLSLTKDPNIALLSARYLVQLKQFIFSFFFFIFCFFFQKKGKKKINTI
jgi:hypothetical protein